MRALSGNLWQTHACQWAWRCSLLVNFHCFMQRLSRFFFLLALLPLSLPAAELGTFNLGSLSAGNAAARTVLVPAQEGLLVETAFTGAGSGSYRIGFKLADSAEIPVTVVLRDSKGTSLNATSANGYAYSPTLTPVGGGLSETYALAFSSDLLLSKGLLPPQGAVEINSRFDAWEGFARNRGSHLRTALLVAFLHAVVFVFSL